MAYPAIAEHRLERLLHEVRQLPEARHSVRFPEWYLRQWHFHPDGYLSRAAVRRYEVVIDRLYNAGRRRPVDRAVVAAVSDAEPAAIVEVGCGTGRLVATLGEKFPGAQVTGVDLSPRMLERARQRVGDAPNVELVHADAASGAHPLKADAVLAVHVLGHTPRDMAAAILENASTIAGANGRVITVDHRWHRAPAVPRNLQIWRRQRLLGGLLMLREYRRVQGG